MRKTSNNEYYYYFSFYYYYYYFLIIINILLLIIIIFIITIIIIILIIIIVLFQKIPKLPAQRIHLISTPPSKKAGSCSFIRLKDRWRISSDPAWGGGRYFFEPYILINDANYPNNVVNNTCYYYWINVKWQYGSMPTPPPTFECFI